MVAAFFSHLSCGIVCLVSSDLAGKESRTIERGKVGLFRHSWQREPFPHCNLTNVVESCLAGDEEAIPQNALHSRGFQFHSFPFHSRELNCGELRIQAAIFRQPCGQSAFDDFLLAERVVGPIASHQHFGRRGGCGSVQFHLRQAGSK